MEAARSVVTQQSVDVMQSSAAQENLADVDWNYQLQWRWGSHLTRTQCIQVKLVKLYVYI